MASGDQFALALPRDFWNGNGPNQQLSERTSGIGAGLPLGRGVGNPAPGDAWYFFGRIWANGTPLPTGLTFGLLWSDDPDNSNPAGVVRIGISVARIVSGTYNVRTPTAFGTEVLASLTAPATVGIVTLSSVAVANANLQSLAAGEPFAVKVRRVPTDAADTHTGRILIHAMTVRDT